MAKGTIGAGIALDGEKEFKQAITGINKDLGVLGSEMGKVTAQFGGNKDSLENLTAKSEVYNKQIETQKEKIDKLKEALTNSSKEYGENDNKTKDWQISLNKAEAQLATTENSLNDTTKQIDEFGNESDDSGEAIEKAGKKAEDSGKAAKSGESGWSKLGDGLKKAGELAGKAVLALGAAATAAGAALVGTSVSAANAADEILTTSAQTGIATDKLQELKYAAELVDVPLETMTNSMAKQIKSMASAQDGSKLMVESYDKLGVSVTNSDGSLRDSQDVYWEVIDALKNVTNETERDALGMQLLGKSAQDLNPLISAGSERMAELAVKAREAGAVMSGETLNSLGALDDQLQFLSGGAEAAKNALGTVLLPMLTTLSTDGVSLLGQFTSGIQGANGDIGKMMDVVSETLGNIVDKIIEYLPQIIDAGLKIISSLGQALLDNLPIIITAAITILTALITGLIDALPQLVAGVLQLMTALVDTLLENLPMIIGAALQIIIQLATGITEALPTLIPALVDTVLMIVDTLIDNIDMLVDASIAIIMALADGIINALPRLMEKAPEIIGKLITAITDNLPKIIEMGVTLIVKLAEGLINAIPQLVAKIPELITTFVNGFANYYYKIWDIGKKMISGMWDGIQSMGNWIKDKIGGFFDGIVGSIKNFFGIHSPSTVFAGFGKNMALGLGEGFADEMVGVSKKINNSVPTNFDLNGNYNVAGNVSPPNVLAESSGRGATINLNIGTYIGDDYSLKQLERKMRGFRILENGRLGGATA